ncbi:hypothetical protein D9M68_914380 [compost metagenome]
MAAINVRFVELPGAVQGVGDVQGRIPVQLVIVMPRQQRGVTGHKVRFLVFIGAPRAGEVHHQTRHPVTLGDVRNHGTITGRPSRRAAGQYE